MASLSRRTKTFTPDAHSTKFLYLILKQLDLKSVNWQEVADNIGIKNGHAARMRWSRFKQQIEGTPSQPKTTKPKKTNSEKSHGKRVFESQEELMRADDGPEGKRMKIEHGLPMRGTYPPYSEYQPASYHMPMHPSTPIKPEPFVKQEPGMPSQRIPSTVSGYPPIPSSWQHQPPPLASIRPPQPPVAMTTTEVDPDNIPMRQLAAQQKNTSTPESQPSTPVKQEPGISVQSTPHQETLAEPATSEPTPTSGTAATARFEPPPSSYEAPANPALPTPKTTSDPPQTSTATTEFELPNSMPPPQLPSWSAPATSGFPPHAPYYAGYPTFYRPRPYGEPYPPQYGQPPPFTMGYQQRPMAPYYHSMGMQSSQMPSYPYPPFIPQNNVMPDTYAGMSYGLFPDAGPNIPDPSVIDPALTMNATPSEEQVQKSATNTQESPVPEHISPEPTKEPQLTATDASHDTKVMPMAEAPKQVEQKPSDTPQAVPTPQSETAVIDLTTTEETAAAAPTPKVPSASPPPTITAESPIPHASTRQSTTPVPSPPPPSSMPGTTSQQQSAAQASSLAPWWSASRPYPTPVAPSYSYPQSAPASFTDNNASRQQPYIHLPQTQVQQQSYNQNAHLTDALGFDFDFSSIQDDLMGVNVSVPVTGSVPMEPQFVVGEDSNGGENEGGVEAKESEKNADVRNLSKDIGLDGKGGMGMGGEEGKQ